MSKPLENKLALVTGSPRRKWPLLLLFGLSSEGMLAQTEVPKRLVILGGGIIGCEFASI
jgi:dihydrolipoamide dehydrogenase